MVSQPGFFDADQRLQALSAAGDPLERLRAVVDFEHFRPELETAIPRSDRSRGGRPPYDAVLMFRVLVLQTLYTLSDDQVEYQLRDRLSFMRFAGLAMSDPVPDAKTIWLFREQLTRAGALQHLFDRFDALLRERGYLAMGGQIVDATIVEARRPRLTAAEKAVVREGRTPAGWPKARTRQIDRDGRWTVKRGRKAPPPKIAAQRHAAGEIAVPVFGCKNHICIDCAHGLSGDSPLPMRRAMTAASLPPCSMLQTPRAACGPTRRIAAPPISRCSTGAAWRRSSSAPNRAVSLCPRIWHAAMPGALACAPKSSTCSAPRSAALV